MFFGYDYFPFVPRIPNTNEMPPTIYAILNSYCNGEEDDFLSEDYVKPTDLAKNGRSAIFDFTYPLTSNISKEDFETLILNHFMMRRIGRGTLPAFKISLSAKLNEIMPKYNKMFDSFINWNIFEDGESYTRNYNESRNDSGTSNSSSNNESDRRFSNEPQNQIQDIKDGSYMSEYNLDTDKATANNSSQTNGSTSISETIKRSPANKMEIYKNMEEINSIYSYIFKDLEVLFYGLL